MQNDLQRANELIAAGRYEEARALLNQIAECEPSNAHVWWLLSFTHADPAEIRRCLSKTVLLDPTHRQARERYQELNRLESHRSKATIWDSGPQSKLESLRRLLFGGMLAMLLMAVILALMLVWGPENKVPIEEQNATQPASAIIASETAPIFATVTKTLSPTTIILPLTPTVELPTSVPTRVAVATYRTRRFYVFPVYIYLASQEPEWIDATLHAVDQLREQVGLDLVLTNDPLEADITIYVLDQADDTTWRNCPDLDRLIGCARLTLIQNNSLDELPQVSSNVWIMRTTSNPRGGLLHELVHALGLSEHSDEPNDIMYPFLVKQETLSPNDILRLKALYELQ